MSDGLVWMDDPGGRRSVMDGDAGIVTSIGFPWGLRCAHCGDIVAEGEAFVSNPIPGSAIGLLTCAPCGLLGAVAGE